MKLGDWLKLVDKTSDEFGLEIKVSGTSVRRYIAGSRIPKPEIQARIRNVTKGAVTGDDWLEGRFCQVAGAA